MSSKQKTRSSKARHVPIPQTTITAALQPLVRAFGYARESTGLHADDHLITYAQLCIEACRAVVLRVCCGRVAKTKYLLNERSV